MSHVTTHPDRAALIAFANGHLDDALRVDLESHVSTCDECCVTIESVAGDSLVDLARSAANGMATPSPAGIDTPTPTTDIPPELIDHPRYKILGKLGAGGMGVVYKAEHRMMGRTVAVKVLNARTTTNAGSVERFRREVRVSSKVAHPNIVTAFDADEADGVQFLVMEFVDGVSLDRMVARRGPLAVPMACEFARLAALALQHAHEHGMVHRDIKPQNLMVTRKGQLKVLDFGLARAVQSPDGGPLADGGVTNPEMVVGTPDYLSPEQARNSTTVDIRSDVYSLGCTLYFLLTGRAPFTGENPLEKMIAHLKDDVPDPREHRSDVSPDVAAVVARMMSKSPAERPASPAAAAAELAPFARSVGPAAAGTVRKADPLEVNTPLPAAESAVPARTAIVVKRPSGELKFEPAPRKKSKSSRRPRRPAESFMSRHRAWIIAGLAILIVGPLLAVGAHRLSRTAPDDGPRGDAGVVAGDSPAGPLNLVGDGPGHGDRSPSPPPGFAAPPAGQARVLIVLPPTKVWLPDVGILHREFETENRVTVETASISAGPTPPHPSSPPPLVDTPAMHDLADINPDDYHAVIFIGEGVDEYLPDGSAAADIRRIIDGFIEQRKPIGSLCVGIKVLGEHGYLDGRDVARCDPKLYDRDGINWLNQLPPAVVSSPFITVGADIQAHDLAAVLMVTLGVRSPGTPPKTGPRPDEMERSGPSGDPGRRGGNAPGMSRPPPPQNGENPFAPRHPRAKGGVRPDGPNGVRPNGPLPGPGMRPVPRSQGLSPQP